MQGKIAFQQSAIHGNGIFATKEIPKGETVFILKGEIVTWVVKDKATSLYGPNWVGLGKNTWINPVILGEHLNHSCEPSCGIKGRLKVVALRDIKKGEEITIDYSITEMDTFWSMKCHCKSKYCRKVIRSIQFLPQKIYNKYMPYVPRYFQGVYSRALTKF